MMYRWMKRGLPLLALAAGAGLLPASAQAAFPEFQDVQALDGDPSPGANGSFINNYLFQDEQINVAPTDGVIKVLRTNQKVEINDYDVAVIPLLHADRREIRNVMRLVTKLEGGRAEVFTDKINKSGTWIQVVAPTFMIPYLRDAVAALDVQWLAEYNDGAQDIYIKMQHRTAADVDLIAENYAGSEGFSTIDSANNSLRRFDEEYRNGEYAKAVALVDIPCNEVVLDIRMYEVNVSNDLKLGVDYVAWKNGPGRSLFSFAEAGYSANQRANNLTSVFDPFIDARAFVFNDGQGKDRVLNTNAVESYRAVNYLLPSSYIDFLQAKGVARVITTGQIGPLCSANTGTLTAENSVVAHVNNANDVGDLNEGVSPSFIFRDNNGGTPGNTDSADAIKPTGTFGSGIYPGGNVAVGSAPGGVAVEDSERRLRYESAGTTGISIEATPYVGLESMELAISVDIGDLNGFAPSGLPIINTRTVSTTVRLLDGQPFVIAGLSRQNDSENSNKAPFLGSLPVVGYLFGGEQTLKRQSDVVITVTPKFHLSSQINIAKPPVVDTMQLIMDGKVGQGAPELSLGFDQYLIGG